MDGSRQSGWPATGFSLGNPQLREGLPKEAALLYLAFPSEAPHNPNPPHRTGVHKPAGAGIPMQPIISVSHLSKTYASGFKALSDINLDIRRGEIFALLGPNGAGKTTLISIICGIVTPSEGTVTVDGHDILADYRAGAVADRPGAAGADDRRRSKRCWQQPAITRGLFGKPRNPAYIETVLQAALAVGQEGFQRSSRCRAA